LDRCPIDTQDVSEPWIICVRGLPC
jgi:hypothetical protein